MTKTFEFAARKAAIVNMHIDRFTKQRIADISQNMSRVGWAKASSEIINEAVISLIGLCYEIDPLTNNAANVDHRTGRLLIVVPWSARRYRLWGLRKSEADALRAYMLRLNELASRGKEEPPLFTFDPISRHWALNFFDYPRKAHAFNWWQQREMTPKLFLSLNSTPQQDPQ